MASKTSTGTPVTFKRKRPLTLILALLLVGLFCIRGILLLQEKTRSGKAQAKPMTALVQKNPAAGLVILGSALNKYHREKGHYPQELLELYPTYIREREVLTTIPWRYRLKGNGHFVLERPYQRKGTQLVYWIDPALKLAKRRAGNKESMLAQASALAGNYKHRTLNLSQAAKALRQARLDEERAEQLSQHQEQVQSSSPQPENQKGRESLPKYAKADVPPELLRISEKLRVSSFLIWVNKRESLCFSNVQYPEMSQIKAICTYNSWLVPEELDLSFPEGQRQGG